MAKLDLDNYVSVNERIAKFREDHPEGAIHTTRETDLTLSEVGTFIRFKALVFRNAEEIDRFGKTGIAPATGHAELMLDADKVSEKCETIAIGRAIAILGYDVTKSVASKEEIASYNEKEGKKFGGLKKLSKAEPEESDDDEEPTPSPRSSRLQSNTSRLRREEPAQVEDDEDEVAPPPRKKSSFSSARS